MPIAHFLTIHLNWEQPIITTISNKCCLHFTDVCFHPFRYCPGVVSAYGPAAGGGRWRDTGLTLVVTSGRCGDIQLCTWYLLRRGWYVKNCGLYQRRLARCQPAMYRSRLVTFSASINVLFKAATNIRFFEYYVSVVLFMLFGYLLQ